MSSRLKKQDSQRKMNFVVDFRNGKYQGQLADRIRVPDGTGMLLTADFQLIVAQWSQGVISGETIFFYPNGNLFYGSVLSGQSVGISVFCFSKERQTVYSFLGPEEESTVILQCEVKKTLTYAKMHKLEFKKMFAAKKVGDISVLYDFNERLKNKVLKVLEVKVYQKKEQKLEIIRQMSGNASSDDYQSYKHFLLSRFSSKKIDKSQRIDVIQASKYTEIRYKKAGLVIRMEQRPNQARRVKLLGYYDNYEEQCDIFLKIRSGVQPQYEQYCQGQSFCYDAQRPSICKISMVNYFRKSANFINKFINDKAVRKIQGFFKAVYDQLDDEISMKHAQSQLEMGQGDQSIPQINEKQKNSHQSSIQNTELYQIKNDLLLRVDRKKSPMKESKYSPLKSIGNSNYSIGKSRRHQRTMENHNYEDYEPKSQVYKQFLEGSRLQKPKQYLKYTDSSPDLKKNDENSRETRRKFHNQKYNYLDEERRKTPYGSNERGFERSQSALHLNLQQIKKKSYYGLEKENRKSHYVHDDHDGDYNDESISFLAGDYERIRQELSKNKYSESKRKHRGFDGSPQGTPTLRSPSKYNYLKPSAFSPAGTPGRVKRQWR